MKSYTIPAIILIAIFTVIALLFIRTNKLINEQDQAKNICKPYQLINSFETDHKIYAVCLDQDNKMKIVEVK